MKVSNETMQAVAHRFVELGVPIMVALTDEVQDTMLSGRCLLIHRIDKGGGNWECHITPLKEKTR